MTGMTVKKILKELKRRHIHWDEKFRHAENLLSESSRPARSARASREMDVIATVLDELEYLIDFVEESK